MFVRVPVSFLFFFIFLAVLGTVAAGPLADVGQDGQEILGASDTRYYGFPGFWYRRPVNEENDDGYGDDDSYGQPRPHSHENEQSNLEIAGAGWGR